MAAETVDTRVVEAKFDSKQFEQGVDKTVKKLDELKKSLNLKDSEKSIADIGNKISETSEKASNSLEQLEKRFTSFFGMLKQKLISGIADEIVGSLFKIKNGFENLVSSMSTVQISRGMQRYTDMLTSVRTMVSAGVDQDKSYELIERLGTYADQTSYSLENLVDLMAKLKVGGADIDTAEKMVEGLSNAAASVGVNAQKAVTAYYNFAQAYQKGAMLQQDWMSFQNIGMSGEKMNEAILQAAEKVGTITRQTKKNGEEVYKTVNKVDKMVKTSGADSKGITAANMGTKLSSRWFNKAVMEEFTAGMYYFSDISVAQINRIDDAIEGLDAEAKKNWFIEHGLSEFAYDAFKAGQEARSFSDVLNTLKDSISRGWATTFEHLFGKLDEATKFFTHLTEGKLATAIYKIGEFRNAVLGSWEEAGGRRNMIEVIDYIDETLGNIFVKMGLIADQKFEDDWFSKNFSQAEYNRLLKEEGEQAAKNYEEDIRQQALEANPWDEYAKELGQRLQILTRNIRDFFDSIKKWFNQTDNEGVSRLQRISNILEGFGKVGSGTFVAIGKALEFVGNVYKNFRTTFDSLWKALDKLSAKFFNLFDPNYQEGINLFQILDDTFENILKVIKPLDEPLSKVVDIITDVVGFFADMGISTFTSNIQFFTDAFALLLEILGIGSAQQDAGRGVLDGIAAGIKELGNTCKEAFTAVSEFVNSAFADLKKALGLDSAGNQNENIFQNIENWFNTNELVQKVKDWFNQAVIDIGDFVKDLPNRIAEIGVNIGDAFKGLFYDYKLTEIRYDGNRRVEIYNWVKKPLTQWITNAADAVKNFVTVDIPNFVKNIPNVVSEFLNGIFYTKNIAQIKYVNGKRTVTYTRTPLKVWLDQAIVDTKAFIKDIPNKVKKVGSIIEEFFKGIFYYKTSVANTGTVWVKKPFTQWVDDNLIKPLKDFVSNLPTYIGQGIGTVGNFFGSIVSAIFGKTDGSTVTSDDVTAELEKPFLNIDLSNIWEIIKGIGRDIINGISSVFTGKTEWTENKSWIETKISTFITGIKDKIDKLWPSVRDWFIDLPNTIAELFSGSSDGANKEDGPIKTAIDGFINGIGTWLSGIPGALLGFVQNAEKQFDSLWTSIVTIVSDAITGKKTENIGMNDAEKAIYEKLLGYDRNAAAGYADQIWRRNNPIFANINEFIINLADYVRDKILSIPKVIKAGWDNAVTVVTAIVDVLTDNVKPELKEDNPVYNIATELCSSIGTWFRENKDALVDKIKSGWDKAITIGSIIGEVLFGDGKPVYDQKEFDRLYSIAGYGDSLAKAYKESTKDYGIYSGIASFFENIKKWILDQAKALPKNIANAWKGVVDFAGEIGPKILEGLNSALEWVKKGFENVTEWISNPENTSKDGKKLSIKEMIDNYVDSAEGQNLKPLWEGAKKVGSTLKEILIKTIPGFISEAAIEIGNQIPNLLSGLFGGSDNQNKENTEQLASTIGFDKKTYQQILKQEGKEAAELYKEESQKGLLLKFGDNPYEDQVMSIATKNAKSLGELLGFVAKAEGEAGDNPDEGKKKTGGLQGFVTGLKDIWGKITEFADKVKTNSTLKIVAVVAAIGLILHELRVLVDNVQFLDDIGYTAKWIGIGTLLTAISGIIGYFAILAANDDDKSDKFEKYKQMLQEIGQFIKDILGTVTWIIGLLAAKELFSAIKEWKSNTNKINKTVQGTNPILDTFLGENGLVGTFLSTLSGGLGTGIATAGKTYLVGGAIGDLVERLAGNVDDALGQLGSGVEVITDHIYKAVKNLNESKEGIVAAIAAVKDVKTLITEMIKLLYIDLEEPLEIDVKDTENNGLKEYTAWGNYFYEQVGDVLVDQEDGTVLIRRQASKIIPNIEEVTNMFNKLSGSLSLFKNAVNGYGDDFSKVVESITTLLNYRYSMKEFGKFAQSNEFKQFKDAFAGIGAIASLYGQSFESIPGEVPDKTSIDKIVETISQFFENEKFKNFINDLATKGLPDIDDKALSTAEKIVILASSISQMAKACKDLKVEDSDPINNLITILSSLTLDDDNISAFVTGFGTLGNALGSFALETSALTYANVNKAQKALIMLSDLAIKLKDIPNESFLSQLFVGAKDLGTFGQGVHELGDNLAYFFKAIENTGEYGESVDYNEHNLDMALKALMGAARVARLLNNVGKIDDDSAFVTIGGKLSGLSEKIRKFVLDTIKIKTENPQVTDENFQFVFDIIKLYDKIANAVYTVSKAGNQNIPTLFDALNKGIFGNDENGEHVYGLLESVNAFVLALSGSTEQFTNIDSILSSFNGMVDIINGLTNALSLITENNGVTTETIKDTVGKLTLAMGLIIEKKQDFLDFFNMASDFSFTGVRNVSYMFEALNQLAQAADLFGRSFASDGLEKLKDFEWTELNSLIEDEINVEPVITPVLVLTDDFKNSAKEMQNLLGVKIGEDGWINPDYSVTISGIDLPQLKSIDEKLDNLKEIKDTVDNLHLVAKDFNTSLAKVRFVIKGEEAAAILGPDMDSWLGAHSVELERIDFKH